MSHIPVNHPLRPTYRVLVALAGLYVLVFGLFGFVATQDSPTFDQGSTSVLGLHTNAGFSLLSVAAGAIILAAFVIGRNVDRFVNLWGGVLFMVVGMGSLAVIRGEANVLNFTMATCVVSGLIGTLLFTAGMYGKSARVRVTQPAEAPAREALSAVS